MNSTDQIIAGWLAIASLWAFVLFGFDKWRAGRSAGPRTAESSLLLVSVLGGWPGGLLGLLFFRHKSAKRSFQLKFAVALPLWATLVLFALKTTGRL